MKIDVNSMMLDTHRYKAVKEKDFQDFKRLLAQFDESCTISENLERLTLSELKTIQDVHGLTQPIVLSELNEEAVRNLVVSKKTDLVDLNNDGIVETGNSKMFMFPPPNAPDSVKSAWESVASEMDFEEYMLAQGMFLAKQFEANCQTDAMGHYQVLKVGEPGYRSAFGLSVESYEAAFSSMIANYKKVKASTMMDSSTLQWKVDILTRLRNRLRSET